MGKIIAVANRKGGVGKTTTVICLAFFLGRHDRRVLVIDLDPQNALSAALSPPGEKPSSGAVGILRGETDPHRIVCRTLLPNVDLIPYARPSIARAGAGRPLAKGKSESVPLDDEALFAMPRTRALLGRAISRIAADYDHVLIDSPPGSSAVVRFALVQAQSVIIPLQCQPLALRIIPRILSDIRDLVETSNPRLAVEGVLLTMYDFYEPTSENIADQVWSYFPKKSTFRAVIRKSPAFEQIFDSENNPLLAEDLPEELLDYDVIAQLILARETSDARKSSRAPAGDSVPSAAPSSSASRRATTQSPG
jgi:chromosome partitioning protein